MATLFFLLHIAFCLTLQPHLAVGRAFYIPKTTLNNPNLVQQACERASDKNLCVDLISSDIIDGPKRSIKDIAFIAFKIAAKNATETSSFIEGIADDNGIAATVQQALSDCSQHYISAAELIEDAIDELVSDSYPDVVKFAEAALDDVDTCNAGVKDQHKVAAVKSLGVRQMLDIALSVTNVAAASSGAEH
ncbi:hypothetical protein LIER_14544 [Lithospermum erythrorhizon]|uniref:Pectinesterase inhibitor domain-containing protein n=1 Tax=Lithospermum erythrorhizon TaxID=34254 RepID=A0AAV3PZI1_LITER